MVWNLDPVFIDFGMVKIHYYGVVFALGIFIGYLFWRKQMMGQGFSEKETEDFVLWAFIAVIVGSRLGHCLFYEPGYYLKHPQEILFFWQGGLASHGATIALLLTLFFYHRIKRIPFLQLCDCFALSASVGATAVRIGNFLNSEIVGRKTEVPWGMKFPRYDYSMRLPESVLRHPSQLYEVALGLFVFSVIFFTDRSYGKNGKKRPVGLLSSLFLIFYFTGRFLVEYFKEYQALPSSSPLTMGQILSIPFALVGYVLFFNVLANGLQPADGRCSPPRWPRKQTSSPHP